MENNLYKNKVVLITGATGLIGSHLVRKLLDLEAEVIAVGRKYRKLEDIFKNEVNNKKLKLIADKYFTTIASKYRNCRLYFSCCKSYFG